MCAPNRNRSSFLHSILSLLTLSGFHNSNEVMNTQQKLHAIVFAFPLQGHVIPTIHLAVKLASNGFTISFINTQSIHKRITKADSSNITKNDDIFAHVRESGLDIRYYVVNEGLPDDFDSSLVNDQFNNSLVHLYPNHIEDFLQEIIPSSNPPITCLIADTVFLWPSRIANKFNLINISFWTEPAIVFALYYHMDLIKQNGHFGLTDINHQDTIDYIPGVSAIKITDLISYMQDIEPTLVQQIMFKSFEQVKEADFVLCNTVQELEADSISALQVEKPFYAVGPVHPIGFTNSSVAMSLWAESDCTKWLDKKSNRSVLYVSFGSLANVMKYDILEIANGLLLSQVDFVWVLRPDIVGHDDQNPLPDQFFGECKDRGLIVPWCHQTLVLSHPSIGGFLSHCGWNSVLESIWCGVPFLCFPLFTDQFTNRKLIVDDWRIGQNVASGKAFTKYEVSENIKSLMSGQTGDGLMNNVMEVRRTLLKATADGGSSQKYINMFIKDLRARMELY